MYDAPRFDYSFNPKRVTHASWEAPPPSPPKPTGPLLDFNRHPDSYVIVPSNKLNVKPMRPKVKDWIRWVRWAQLAFRWMQLFGAIGMLICVICITNTQNTEGWILRLPVRNTMLVAFRQLTRYNSRHLIYYALHMRPTIFSAPQRDARQLPAHRTTSSRYSAILGLFHSMCSRL